MEWLLLLVSCLVSGSRLRPHGCVVRSNDASLGAPVELPYPLTGLMHLGVPDDVVNQCFLSSRSALHAKGVSMAMATGKMPTLVPYFTVLL